MPDGRASVGHMGIATKREMALVTSSWLGTLVRIQSLRPDGPCWQVIDRKCPPRQCPCPERWIWTDPNGTNIVNYCARRLIL